MMLSEREKGIVLPAKLPSPRHFDVTHTLDGHALVDGERVALIFPNGKRITRTVVVKADDLYWGKYPKRDKKGKLEPMPENEGHQYFMYRAYVMGPRDQLVCLFRFTHDSQVPNDPFGKPGRIERIEAPKAVAQ